MTLIKEFMLDIADTQKSKEQYNKISKASEISRIVI